MNDLDVRYKPSNNNNNYYYYNGGYRWRGCPEKTGQCQGGFDDAQVRD